ncbi:stAR-related lipid transfer protein 4 isoform X2 [Podarcis raffonei]|uniref:stAR-related lipid transfer protein 4 isoform X2 n=1 Tax=Podarcis raffonei TaxID=65483 RepID=UPI0023297C9A|nr:stAR-related lipid transfer protein 4 isoform X2 [Podarcis raffonei]
MADFPDVVSVATKLKNEVIRYYNVEDDEWRLTKKTKDTTVWRKPSEEFNGYLYKAQGIVEDVANRIVDHIRPGPYRLYWDSLMTSMDIVDEFEENCCIMRYTTAGQLWNIISPREFVDFSCTTDYEDGILSCVIVSYPNLNLFFTGTLIPIKSVDRLNKKKQQLATQFSCISNHASISIAARGKYLDWYPKAKV